MAYYGFLEGEDGFPRAKAAALKALELDRLRAFNENIIESLDDGLLVVDLNDRVLRWNHAFSTLYGVGRAEAIGRSLHEVFDPPFVEAVRAARRDAPGGSTLSRIPLAGRGAVEGTTRIVSVTVVPLRAVDDTNVSTVGTSQIIRPDGSTVAGLDADEAGALLEDVELRSGLTAGVVLGPWIQLGMLVAAALLVAAGVLSRRRR